jgi:hypothetical protein
MLNIIRVIVISLGGISLVLTALNCFSILGFTIRNKTAKYIVYCTFIICSLFLIADIIYPTDMSFIFTNSFYSELLIIKLIYKPKFKRGRL